MRKIFLFLMLAFSFTLVVAQEQSVLRLSQAQSVIRITDPQQRIAQFEPLISRLDDLCGMIKPDGENVSTKLDEVVNILKTVPGIQMTGDFWVVILPSDNKAHRVAEPGAVLPKEAPPTALIVPLRDVEAFRAFYAQNQKNMPAVQILNDQAVMEFSAAKMPQLSGIDFDVKLASSREIVFRFPTATLDALPHPEAGSPLEPLTQLLGDMATNQQAWEVGLTMKGDVLSAETFITPVRGSALAHSVNSMKASALPFELTSYLPENLAFCSSSGPMIEGAAGFGYISINLAIALGALVIEPDRQQALQDSFNALANQCTLGRAIGLTTPANPTSESTLIAVYQVQNKREAATAVNAFTQEVVRTKDSVLNGMLTTVIKIFHKPAVEQIAGVPVDLLKIILPAPPQKNGKAAGEPTVIECRIAYMGDKMLFAAGKGCTEQMTALINRIALGKAGFTASKRFAAMKASLPASVHGFMALDTLDLCRTGIALIPMDAAQQKEAQKWLSIFPAHRSTITCYTECQDGLLHSDFLIPGEQIDFISTLVRTIAIQNSKGTKAEH